MSKDMLYPVSFSRCFSMVSAITEVDILAWDREVWDPRLPQQLNRIWTTYHCVRNEYMLTFISLSCRSGIYNESLDYFLVGTLNRARFLEPWISGVWPPVQSLQLSPSVISFGEVIRCQRRLQPAPDSAAGRRRFWHQWIGDVTPLQWRICGWHNATAWLGGGPQPLCLTPEHAPPKRVGAGSDHKERHSRRHRATAHSHDFMENGNLWKLAKP